MTATPKVVQLAQAGGLDARQEDRPCSADPDAMFFDDNSKATQADRNYLRERLCMPCPLRSLCLDAAIERRERYGMWGGIDFLWERYLLKKHQPDTPSSTRSTTPEKRPA